MKQLITVLRKHAARALCLMLALPYSLSLSISGHASTIDTKSTSDFALFQTDTTGETTEEGTEEEEEPDC